jgi:predicted nucleic acid-binding protein
VVRQGLQRALNADHSGFDFADAIHRASADSCETFISFDDCFRKRPVALGLGLEPLVVKPA